MDKTSLNILTILQNKARVPNAEVSRKVGLAPSAVLERIRKMEKQGIIDGYEVRLNPQRFNRSLIAFIYIYVEMGRVDAIGKTLAQLEDVQEVHFVSGKDCFLIKMRCENNGALGLFLEEKIMPLPGVVSTTTQSVLKTIKETSRIPLTTLSKTE